MHVITVPTFWLSKHTEIQTNWLRDRSSQIHRNRDWWRQTDGSHWQTDWDVWGKGRGRIKKGMERGRYTNTKRETHVQGELKARGSFNSVSCHSLTTAHGLLLMDGEKRKRLMTNYPLISFGITTKALGEGLNGAVCMFVAVCVCVGIVRVWAYIYMYIYIYTYIGLHIHKVVLIVCATLYWNVCGRIFVRTCMTRCLFAF